MVTDEGSIELPTTRTAMASEETVDGWPGAVESRTQARRP
jgi:hypothetical protein